MESGIESPRRIATMAFAPRPVLSDQKSPASPLGATRPTSPTAPIESNGPRMKRRPATETASPMPYRIGPRGGLGRQFKARGTPRRGWNPDELIAERALRRRNEPSDCRSGRGQRARPTNSSKPSPTGRIGYRPTLVPTCPSSWIGSATAKRSEDR